MGPRGSGRENRIRPLIFAATTLPESQASGRALNIACPAIGRIGETRPNGAWGHFDPEGNRQPILSDAYSPGEAGKTTVLVPFGNTR